ncbi:unnamed protein product [Thlaspi arvense]|uniref:Bet v I/Major latex protein domain-containing protein n=1 Tax=Thlaspi arvense TaxID=13288 RepID=A0AAU9T7U8_THLAR|nr:unnamed protein product [Thlaspi arvense]
MFLTGKLEKICYEIQLVASEDEGTIAKTTSKYYSLDGVEISDDKIKTGQERSGAMFKVLALYQHLICLYVEAKSYPPG